MKTPEKSQEDEEAMPPYEADTQLLIEGWFRPSIRLKKFREMPYIVDLF